MQFFQKFGLHLQPQLRLNIQPQEWLVDLWDALKLKKLYLPIDVTLILFASAFAQQASPTLI